VFTTCGLVINLFCFVTRLLGGYTITAKKEKEKAKKEAKKFHKVSRVISLVFHA